MKEKISKLNMTLLKVGDESVEQMKIPSAQLSDTSVCLSTSTRCVKDTETGQKETVSQSSLSVSLISSVILE